MDVRIKLRRGYSLDWDRENPILSLGEPGYETDTKRLKIGDGVRNWRDLEFVSSGISEELSTHVGSSNPHPAYDDLASLSLLFENGLI